MTKERKETKENERKKDFIREKKKKHTEETTIDDDYNGRPTDRPINRETWQKHTAHSLVFYTLLRWKLGDGSFSSELF